MTSRTASLTQEASSIGREFASGLIGAVVTVCCVFPPILHFVTGPLGPLIGGFVAANRVQPTPRARAIVAFTIATTLATFIGSALAIASSIAAHSELPDWFPTTPTKILVIATVVWTYAGTLATVGTITRSAMARNQGAR